MDDPAQLLIRFFRKLDERDYTGLARLMTPDGVWSRQGKQLSGEAMIVAELSKRSPTLRIHHLLTNVFADPGSDGGADVTAYMLVVRHDDGKPLDGPAPFAGIENIRTLTAHMTKADGGWKIAKLEGTAASFQK